MTSELFKWFKPLYLISYGLIIVTIVWQCYERPSYNADIMPYMAVVLGYDDSDLTRVHQQAYVIAKEQIPSLYYERITDIHHTFRNEIRNDVDKFFQNVSFFKVKPLYNFSIYIFYKLGASLVKATILPSLLSFLFITALLFYWLNDSMHILKAMLISLGIVISPPVLEAARLSTPDALSTAFVLLSFYLIFKNYNWFWIVLTLSMSIIARLDNIILAFLLLLFYHFFQSRKESKLTFSRNSIVHIIILIVWTLYGFLIMQYANYQNAFENAFTEMWINKNPFRVAIKGMTTIQFSYLPTVMIICGVVIFKKRIDSLKSFTQTQWFYLLMVLYIFIKYLAFPNLTTRFYLPVYIVVIVMMVEELFSRIQTGNPKSS